MGLLDGQLARIVANAGSQFFFDAVLTRDAIPDSPAYEEFDPPAPVPVLYTCKALDTEYSAGLRAQGLVGAKDVEVTILATTLSVEPQPGDRITVRGATFTIVPANSGRQKAVQGDPARATWSCRCMT